MSNSKVAITNALCAIAKNCTTREQNHAPSRKRSRKQYPINRFANTAHFGQPAMEAFTRGGAAGLDLNDGMASICRDSWLW
jgi:hypothetical protein